MILPEYLEKDIIIYCQIKNISIRNGIVPSQHISEIENFIGRRLKKDRVITKMVEEDNKLSIGSSIKEWVNDLLFLKTGEWASPIEEYLLDELIKANLSKYCCRQFQIGTKRVDFAFLIAKLAVECDGRQYHFTEPWQLERDQKRDKYLARKGWRVLHIEGFAIRRNIGLCMDKIKKIIKPFIQEFEEEL